MMKIFLLLLVLCMVSCGRQAMDAQFIVREWTGKEILFPQNSVFTIGGKDTVEMSHSFPYKVLSYIDPNGCLSCKLQLSEWKQFVKYLDYLKIDSVQCLFYSAPQNKASLLHEFEVNLFHYPVCIDERDSLNKLNHFPSEMEFQTFLLDKDNKVLAIGNPVLNPGVKELYLKIIQGKPLQDEGEKKQVQTTVSLDTTTLSLGKFPWQEEQQATFTLKNTGDELLVIHDVVTSCGCLQVDYSQEPVRPGKEAVLHLTYKADYAGYVSKTVQVYCNAKGSPVKFWVEGEAE